MKFDIQNVIITTLIINLFYSCQSDQKAKSTHHYNTPYITVNKTHSNVPPVKKLYVKGDSICITVDSKTFHVAKDSTINVNNPYDGIYEVNNGNFKKHFSLIKCDLLYFNTSDDVGFGYRANLYVYNLKKKTFITDNHFHRNYLYSSAGVFFLTNSKIIVMGKSSWYEKENTGITPASIYSIKGTHFKYQKSIYTPLDSTADDTSITNFYNKNWGKKAKKQLLLPADWWKQ
ncbi:hypothetical protein GCM10023149_09250 [Mucilaginibacter gynuensis]|uniref:DKNYY family protein n=1 Tax=Mucilaginibacter gynuensis TaxID=1302236 RepID=A0ABP8FY63_9SPHI